MVEILSTRIRCHRNDSKPALWSGGAHSGRRKEELEAFIDAVRDSGLGPMIRDEHCEWSEAEGQLKGFEIIQ